MQIGTATKSSITQETPCSLILLYGFLGHVETPSKITIVDKFELTSCTMTPNHANIMQRMGYRKSILFIKQLDSVMRSMMCTAKIICCRKLSKRFQIGSIMMRSCAGISTSCSTSPSQLLSLSVKRPTPLKILPILEKTSGRYQILITLYSLQPFSCSWSSFFAGSFTLKCQG
jgi:hypothetical protein